jgi:hypothetical protein
MSRVFTRVEPVARGRVDASLSALGLCRKRLGRALTGEDFKDLPVNSAQARVCPELAARLRPGP